MGNLSYVVVQILGWQGSGQVYHLFNLSQIKTYNVTESLTKTWGSLTMA